MSNQILDLLDQLYTFTFTIEETMTISRVSSRLADRYPQILEESSFFEAFDCHRPAGIHTFKDLQASDKSLFLLISNDRKLALKGQLIPLADSNAYHFVGMPWLAWMNEKAPDTKLHLGDFPKLDSQMDQDFYFTSQQSMVRDLEALNEKLTIAEEDAKEANRAQSDLFAVMSHEMRTPLNGVISALSLLTDEESPLERNKLISIANQSANNLLSVINYTLDYSKIDAGRMVPQEQDFNLNSLIESVIAVSEGRAKQKGLRLVASIEPGIAADVRGDSEKLRQILINIVGNAIKFTDDGEVTVSVSLKDTHKSLYSFIIRDTGNGIDKEDLEKIFDPFWGKASEKSGSSTGLGLNIVQRLTEIMSGSVSVKSSAGAGTTFEVRIPLSASEFSDESTALVKSTSSTKLAMPDTFSGKVLLVDDNQTNLMLGKMILEKHGTTVRTATNGQEAVDISRDVSFDLVFMDVSMPVMDGISATKAINQQEAPPPVIALTANVRDELVEKYLAEGFRGYLKKPLESEALITELNLWLKPASLEFVGTVGSEKELSKLEVLEALVHQIGEENFERVRSLFLEETARRTNVLLSAWVRRDMEALRKEAHTISSSVASFGCEDLAWRLKQIEQASSENDVREIIKYMKDIESASTESLKAVTDFNVTEEA